MLENPLGPDPIALLVLQWLGTAMFTMAGIVATYSMLKRRNPIGAGPMAMAFAVAFFVMSITTFVVDGLRYSATPYIEFVFFVACTWGASRFHDIHEEAYKILHQQPEA